MKAADLTAQAPTTRWLGYRLAFEPPFEPFLAGSLATFFATQRRQGKLRRAFFLRHSSGGLHLRLRLLPERSTSEAEVAAAVYGLVAESTETAPGASLDPFPYNRTEHAFGETWSTVYAELLHEATSRLAFQLLAGEDGSSARRWLVTAAAVLHLARSSSTEPRDLEQILREGRGFARQVAEGTGHGTVAPAGESHRRRLELLVRIAPRVAEGIEAHPDTGRCANLLMRVRRRPRRGRFVATHALHLFCNEVGLSIHEEYGLFSTLCELLGSPSHPIPKEEAS